MRLMTTHFFFDRRLQLYKRKDGRTWQCAARVGGVRFRESTQEESLERAKDVAEEWYLSLRGKLRNGLIEKAAPKEMTFRQAWEHYLAEVRVLAETVRSPNYVKYMVYRVQAHILPFFGDKCLSEINRGLVQTYRVRRAEDHIKKTALPDAPGKPPARSTQMQEIVHIRQVLKHAEANGWLQNAPTLSMPYLTSGKKERRAWFSPEEYKSLYKETRARIDKCERRGYRTHYEEMHNTVLFMANTGLRPDEKANLQIRDVQIVHDNTTGENILEIDVRGKTGVGYCKSMPGAVFPFQQVRDLRIAELKKAGKSQEEIDAILPNTRLFRKFDRHLFNSILEATDLKFDRDGRRRTVYSLRHTYISLRLSEGASIFMVANNCRTSVQMIEQFYAAHIKDRLDTAFINVQRPKPSVKKTRNKPRSQDEAQA